MHSVPVAAIRNPSCCCCCCFHFHEISLEIPFRWSAVVSHPSHSHHTSLLLSSRSLSFSRTHTNAPSADVSLSLFLAHAGGVQSLVSNRTFSRQKKIETHTGNLHTLHFFEKFTSNCHSARCLLFDGSGREILVPVPTKDARVVAGSKQSNGNAAPRIKNWIVVVHTHTRPRNSAIISNTFTPETSSS